MVISSTGPIAAITNQQLNASGASSYNPQPPFSTYSGSDTGSLKVTLPAVMYNWYNYYTDIFIMNVGGGDASNVDISFIPGEQLELVALRIMTMPFPSLPHSIKANNL